MPKGSTGQYFVWYGRVTNVLDPEMAGRVQVRILGKHDDTTNVPDLELPWARPMFPTTNPIHQGIAGPTTGLLVGSTVMVIFADPDEQLPIVIGSLGNMIWAHRLYFSVLAILSDAKG